jgi:hypothetical protein
MPPCAPPTKHHAGGSHHLGGVLAMRQPQNVCPHSKPSGAFALGSASEDASEVSEAAAGGAAFAADGVGLATRDTQKSRQ